MSDEREIQEVLARCLRATDHRDGAAMSDIFPPEGKVEIVYDNVGAPELLGGSVGPQTIGAAVTLDAQFVVVNVVGAQKPEGGWPEGAPGAQGTIAPIEADDDRPRLKKADEHWGMAPPHSSQPSDGFLGEAI